jgi:predicted regulator of amino acid metabolism with ACT domain
MNSLDSQTEILREISITLRELTNWVEVLGRNKVKVTLEKVLDNEQKRLVYDLCDGEKSVKDIEKLTGVNVRYISEWSQEWERIGIVEQGDLRKGRRKKLFNLAVFGIGTPNQDS